MPATFQALAVFVFAALPGALYVWSFERLVGEWGLTKSDRLLRFVGFSALFQVVALPGTWFLWHRYISSGTLVRGRAEPIEAWLLWAEACLYVVIPILSGSLLGLGTRAGSRWARFFTGRDPFPRAWDFLFAQAPNGWIRIRTKGGAWLAGAFGQGDGGSYASGYPEEGDLLLRPRAEVDPDTGAFVFDEAGNVRLAESAGLLVRWQEVEYLEFIQV